MQVIVKGKNIEVTDALRAYVEKKFKKLPKYIENANLIAEVIQSVERNWHIIEVTVDANGLLLRGEERSEDMYASVDKVVEKLEQQLKKHKDKLIEKNREKESEGEISLDKVETSFAPKIVKTKRFAVKPMSVDEATMQMELLKHSFFVFFNADTKEVNVLYKRNDGDYGLIEPEF